MCIDKEHIHRGKEIIWNISKQFDVLKRLCCYKQRFFLVKRSCWNISAHGLFYFTLFLNLKNNNKYYRICAVALYNKHTYTGIQWRSSSIPNQMVLGYWRLYVSFYLWRLWFTQASSRTNSQEITNLAGLMSPPFETKDYSHSTLASLILPVLLIWATPGHIALAK